MRNKKWISLLLTVTLLCASSMTVFATQDTTSANGGSAVSTDAATADAAQIAANTSKPYLALGADLTPEQTNTVLGLMGLSSADLANYNVVYITNEQEHQYLDAYVDKSVIGTKSLSSVLVKQAPEGHGVVVSTKNISYCTTGMYRNALLTAGVKDADIMVVAPTPITGTAGLIGALKAYEEMSGESISNTSLDTALNELVTTGQIASTVKSANSEEVEALIAYIKAKMAAGELKTDEDIRKAIADGEVQFGVDLTDDEVNQIVDVMNKIYALGLDPEVLLDQAKDLYDKFGDSLITNPDQAFTEIVSNAISNMVSNIGDTIMNFFKNLFS